jgi:adenine-specific DNA-methyltransferase
MGDEKLARLLALVPPDGTPKGNIRLIQESGLSEDDYWPLRNKLIEQGKIGKGKGKGGSVYRLVAEDSSETSSSRLISRKTLKT